MPEEVRYLVFEGGGGKGFAYLGALRALEAQKVLQYSNPQKSDPPGGDGRQHAKLDNERIKGVAGASAGAITALLVSIGYTVQELADLMSDSGRFLAFFDGGFNGKIARKGAPAQNVKRLRPIYGGCIHVKDTDAEIRFRRTLGAAESVAELESRIVKWESRLGIPGLAGIDRLLTDARKVIGEESKKPPFDVLIAHWKDFYVNFSQDWGLFAGCSARALFDELLANRLPLINGKPHRDATFQDHFNYFKVELLVTGTNILTGKSEVFSVFDSPNFQVADAVRISMGLPFAFKPVRILDERAASDTGRRGVWVDGGLLNNLPFREFDGRSGQNPKTLSIRLEVEMPVETIKSSTDFIKNYLKLGLMGPGEAFVTSKYTHQAIVLDTKGLGTIDFAPPKEKRRPVEIAAMVNTHRYFDPRDITKPSEPVMVERFEKKKL